MKRPNPLLPGLVAVVVALCTAGPLFAQPTPPPSSPEIRVEPEVQEAAPNPRAATARAQASQRAGVVLDVPGAEEVAQLKPPARGTPLQVGFGRGIAATRSEAELKALLRWEMLDDGRQVAALAVTSPQASALRVGIRVGVLPAGTLLRFYAPEASDVFEATGAQVMETVGRNLDAGEHDAEARTYWSPVIESPTLVVEFELPAGIAPEQLHIAIPRLSHLVTSSREDFIEKAAQACELDAMCYQSTWGAESNAVARMIFTSAGASYLCTGTLVADKDTSTAIPHFLSANHCISSQSVASSLQTYWFWRSTACNSGLKGASQTLTGGATLLYASSTTDTSFMKLNAAPPAGAVYAGWLVGSTWSLNTAITGLHHPAGDLLKISFGRLYTYASCYPTGSGTFGCDTASAGTATFLGVVWDSGLTEPGSSGSGLFVNNGRYLLGQLYGGGSSCTSSGIDFYGRFDVAYNAALKQWLGVTASSYTLAVTKSGNGTGTVTSSPAGISCGSTCSASFAQETVVNLSASPASGSAFSGWTGACSGVSACNVTMNAATSVGAAFSDLATTPSAPRNLVAIAGNGMATFTFDPPASNGGSAIVRYTASCGGNPASGSSSPIAVTGLQNSTTYACSVTATNATTTGPAATASVTPTTRAQTSLVAVRSRKTHAAVGTLDLAVDTSRDVSGSVTVEPRTDLSHRLVFTFSNPVSTAGVLTVTDASGVPVGSASAASSGSDVVVTLTGVDGRRVRVALSGVNSSIDASAAVGFLSGDVRGNGGVTSSDVLAAKGRSGQAAISNVAYDVDLSGAINASDVASVKARSGSSLQ